MNTPTTPHSSALTFEGLVTAIGQAHVVLAQQATKAVNISLTLRNWALELYRAYPQIVQTASAQSTHLFPSTLPGEKVPSLTALSQTEPRINPEKLLSELSYTHFEQLPDGAARQRRNSRFPASRRARAGRIGTA